MQKIIFHIDVNAFFTSVEEMYNPVLKTKPIGICNNNSKAVLCTCNYVARQYGVTAAMNASKAKKLCPQIIFIKPKMHLYEKISQHFMDLIRTKYTTEVEIASIDECYVDVSEIIDKYHNNPIILATQMQNLLLNKLNLPVSIGISNSKYFAKIASDFKKPLGIYTLYKSEIKEKFWNLPIENFYGIGNKKIHVLHELGIHTILEFKNYVDQDKLKLVFHNQYFKIMDIINGNINDDIVISKQAIKTLSKANTFLKAEVDLERIFYELEKVVKKLTIELEKNFLLGKCLTLMIKTNNQKTISKSKTFTNNIDHKNLFNLAKNLFIEIWDEQVEIKYLSLGISKLQHV